MSQENVEVVRRAFEAFSHSGRPPKRLFDPERLPRQSNLISRFTMMVSAIDSTIDQTRHPGMKRTCVRSPDRFQIMNIAHRLAMRRGEA